MAKIKEKREAYILYTQLGKSAKECAKTVGVSEQTLSGWVQKENWKAERAARAASPTKQIENIKHITRQLAEQRIELTRELSKAEKSGDKTECERLCKAIAGVDDGVAKWNKHLQTVDKESAITLAVYLDIMEQVFSAMQYFNPKLFMETLPFQEQHVHDISNKLG